MGMFVNPGNEGFRDIVADEYVDKTGLIALVNRAIGTPRKMVCVTRPRRFGKSFAAESLVSYYSCGCDSRELFEGLAISRDESFRRHLNAYNVIRLDMSAFRNASNIVAEVERVVLSDARALVPEAGLTDAGTSTELLTALTDLVDATGRRIIFVIDEWDAPLRERHSKAEREDWVYFLRQLFKNSTFTAKAVAAAYMTGILPIVRYGTQSALTDFREYTMLEPDAYAPYVGFTDADVKALAERNHMDMCELRRWYDGYELPDPDAMGNDAVSLRVYAPYSVKLSCENHRVGRYWTDSEAFSSLRTYIDLDFDGLQRSIVQMLGGMSVPLSTSTFENDVREVSSADDVLTLLCHLGYLAYDGKNGTCRVPNEEVRAVLRDAVRGSRHPEVARIVRESDELLEQILDGNGEAVAEAIGRVHDAYTAPLFYNNEQALRSVVKVALVSAVDYYARVEELPSGRGLADIVYLPKQDTDLPALAVELKWSKTPGTAIVQIRTRDYSAVLRDWGGPVLLVGITYDPKTKEHSCVIEEL